MGGREQQTAGDTQAQQRYVDATDLIENDQDVIEHTLEEPTLLMGNPIRRARTPRVEPDVTAE